MGDRPKYTLDDIADSITLKEFADLARVSLRTAQRMVDDHEIDALHITKRKILIPNRAVAAWFRSCSAA